MNESKSGSYLSGPSSGATMTGYIALLMWSCYALMVTFLHNIPTFELLSVVFLGGFTLIAFRLTARNEWYKIKQPWPIWLIGIGGIVGNDFANIAALKVAPPVQVTLINYLWPMFVVLLASFLPKERFTIKHIVSSCLGLLAIYILVTHGQGLSGFNWHYLNGYILAFSASLVWACYCVMSRYYYHTPIEMLGMYFGIGVLVSLLCHVSYETTVVPSLFQWFVLIAMIFSTSGVAYFCWDYGCKKGHVKLLSILSYGNPVISTLMLILFTSAQYSYHVAIACILVVLAWIISSLKWSSAQQYCFKRIKMHASPASHKMS